MTARIILQSIKMLIVFTLITGAVYPCVVGFFAWTLFPARAGGSLVYANGKIAGSELLGQKFVKNIYFMPRPSATGYSAVPSGATNYGPQSASLRDFAAMRRKELKLKFGSCADILNSGAAAEMLFSSASGLDPHISPQSAAMQAESVAAARGYDQTRREILRKIIEDLTEKPQFGILGRPRINVLKLNMEIDKI